MLFVMVLNLNNIIKSECLARILCSQLDIFNPYTPERNRGIFYNAKNSSISFNSD